MSRLIILLIFITYGTLAEAKSSEEKHQEWRETSLKCAMLFSSVKHIEYAASLLESLENEKKVSEEEKQAMADQITKEIMASKKFFKKKNSFNENVYFLLGEHDCMSTYISDYVVEALKKL